MPPSPPTARFRPELFRFLRELARHNRRDWFLTNKARYERDVLVPSLAFVEAMAGPIHRLSPELVADARPVGGSLMRIYRDVRFSRDKSPYRTSVGIHFSHRASRAHEGGLPGFFLHLAPGDSFVGAGVWRASPPDLARIQGAVVADSAGWRRARSVGLSPDEEALRRVPPGFPQDHPFAEDLRRKSFVASNSWSDGVVASSGFPTKFLAECRRLDPLNRFLAASILVPY
jgi:uncharacterized protein (TIGR02453 family)